MRRTHRIHRTASLFATLLLAAAPAGAGPAGKPLHPPVDDFTYIAHCGVCHAAYAPELLPAAAWQRILENLADHFGEWVELEAAPRRDIARFLESRAADRSNAEIARHIAAAPAGAAGDRITAGAFFAERHRNVPPPSAPHLAGEPMADCSACHPGNEQGDYTVKSGPSP